MTNATELLLDIRRKDTPNPKTFKSVKSNILNLRRFLQEEGLPDSLATLARTDIFDRYADWLRRQPIAMATANQRITTLAANLRILAKEPNLDFKPEIPKKLPKFEDDRDQEEKIANELALTEKQLDKLVALEELTPLEAKVRDMFLIQCYSGIRVEDIPQILSTKNRQTLEGEPFSIFTPKKVSHTKLKSTIPLANPYPRLLQLVDKYADKCPMERHSNEYNDLIRQVCHKAGFNKMVTTTPLEADGEKKKVRKHLWELMHSHIGRHTFVTNCKHRGLSDKEIIKITGHATPVYIRTVYDNTAETY